MAQEEPVTVKQLNKEHIRAYMGKHTSASKSQIARELGLSFPTVGRLIDELCSDGELTGQGAGSSTGGRCACIYELNPLFSPVSYTHLVLTKPIVSFGSNALCYYETFFQVQFKEQDFYLERGYFDLLEWLPETVPLHQYLERGQFNQLIYKVYQNTSTYSLEQLCEMEKKIKLKHIRLWNEKKIQYSVTRFSNIIQDLLDAGVNTYFVYPKYEILQESVTLLLQEIHLKTIVQNQNAITALNQQFSDGASVMAPQLSKDPDASAPLTSRSRQLSQKAGISVSYADRLLTALSAMDRDCITSQALAAALHITPRSANRLLGRLSATGIFLELERQPSFTRGRPEKIYQFHPELIS